MRPPTSRSSGFGRWPMAGLSLLMWFGSGCADWPHFDYADVTPVTVMEVETDGPEQAQNIHRLYGDADIQGRIDDTGYQLEDGFSAPFELPGWYSGDMDWFQFVLWERLTDVNLTLDWADDESVLDLYFCETRSDGSLALVDYRELKDPGIALPVDGLNDNTVYVVAVAGREGPPADYQLLLTFNTLNP